MILARAENHSSADAGVMEMFECQEEGLKIWSEQMLTRQRRWFWRRLGDVEWSRKNGRPGKGL